MRIEGSIIFVRDERGYFMLLNETKILCETKVEVNQRFRIKNLAVFSVLKRSIFPFQIQPLCNKNATFSNFFKKKQENYEKKKIRF